MDAELKIQNIYAVCLQRAQDLILTLKKSPNSETLPGELQTFYIGLRNFIALTTNDLNGQINLINFDVFASHQTLSHLCEEISALGQAELEKLSSKIVSIRKEKIRLSRFKSTHQASSLLSDVV